MVYFDQQDKVPVYLILTAVVGSRGGSSFLSHQGRALERNECQAATVQLPGR